jgi:hypothetical protein
MLSRRQSRSSASQNVSSGELEHPNTTKAARTPKTIQVYNSFIEYLFR